MQVPAPFEYARASSVDEAIALLERARLGGPARGRRALAGADDGGEPAQPEAAAPSAAPPPPPPPAAPTRPAPAHEDALDLGSIGGAVVGERLKDPCALGGLLAIVALLGFVLGLRSRGGG